MTEKKYTKSQFILASEIGEVSLIDAKHTVSLLDEAVEAESQMKSCNTKKKLAESLQQETPLIIYPKFFDYYGTEVFAETKIVIEKTYNSQNYFQNQLAVVFWEEKKGMYKFKLISDMLPDESGIGYDFQGIHSFKVYNT